MRSAGGKGTPAIDGLIDDLAICLLDTFPDARCFFLCGGRAACHLPEHLRPEDLHEWRH